MWECKWSKAQKMSWLKSVFHWLWDYEQISRASQGLNMGFTGFMLRSKHFLCSLKCALNTNPWVKPTPLAMLSLKLLLKAREQPCKALDLDGFALNINTLWLEGSRNLSGKWRTKEEIWNFNSRFLSVALDHTGLSVVYFNFCYL